MIKYVRNRHEFDCIQLARCWWSRSRLFLKKRTPKVQNTLCRHYTISMFLKPFKLLLSTVARVDASGRCPFPNQPVPTWFGSDFRTQFFFSSSFPFTHTRVLNISKILHQTLCEPMNDGIVRGMSVQSRKISSCGSQ